MSTLNVLNEVKIYEVDGKETRAVDGAAPLRVRSHWNRDTLVVLEDGDGRTITVVARDLLRAIQNATNT